MKILITGRDGQVAQSLAERASGHELVFKARPDFDLVDPASIERTIATVRPELIISAAAYTAVDQAEDEPDLAMAANGEAPGIIGHAAAKIGAPVLHLSTDYVFGGSGELAWTEDDPTGPIGTYGKTKLAGEEALASSGARYVILRTSWVYSPYGDNFVKTMLRLAETHDVLNVVVDQYGNPTSALDIADALMTVASRLRKEPCRNFDAIYNFAGSGTTTWAEFATTIFAESAVRGGPSCKVTGIPAVEYPARATRPVNSRLDCTKFVKHFGYAPPLWRSGVARTIERLVP